MFRTIQQVYDLVKKADPNSAITKYRIRELVRNGQVQKMGAGTKILIDCRSLQEVLGMTLINVG